MSLENKPDVKTETNCPICGVELVASEKAKHIRKSHS